VRLHGAQPEGCAPISGAWKAGLAQPRPVKPDTIVRSLAIGDPATARRLATIRRTDGRAEDPGDNEVVSRNTAARGDRGPVRGDRGGTVVASARRLAQAGAFADGEPVVLQISGQGMKTVEALQGSPPSRRDRRPPRGLRGVLEHRQRGNAYRSPPLPLRRGCEG